MTQLHSYEALEALVLKLGFLPFFKNEISGFSVEEYTPSKLWFSDEADGPWEWKGPVAGGGKCAYGKLFSGKAGFVSMEWFPELVNYRRHGFNLNDEIYKQSKVRLIYDTVIEHESLLSKELKALCGYKKPRATKRFEAVESWENKEVKKLTNKGEGFDTVMTRLQMGTWLVAADFEYQYDKQLKPYGWGVGRYTTPEALFGKEVVQACRHHSPEESKLRILEYISKLLPQATEAQILRLIG